MSLFLGRPERFEMHLQRSVAESERHSIPTLNDLSLAHVEDARNVRRHGGRHAACEYLAFFVEKHRSPDIQDFCEEVLEQGKDAATWRISDLLIGLVESRREGLSLTVEKYINRMNQITGERWFRGYRLGGAIGEIRTSSVGPGVVLPEMRYWSRFDLPEGEPAFRVIEIDPQFRRVERIPDTKISVEIRRWMATLAAWWARDYLIATGPHTTPEGIIGAFPSPIVPSQDGAIAIRAIAREAQLSDPRWPREVGFIGPDEWYSP